MESLDGEMLDGMKAIVDFLGRGWTRKRVKTLIVAGAPILVTGAEEGRRYVCVRVELEAFLRSPPINSG